MSSTPVFKSYDQVLKDKAQAEYERAVELGIAEILRSKEFSEIDPTVPGAKKAIVKFCQDYASNIPGAVPSLFLLQEAKKQNHLAFKETFKPFLRPVSEQRQAVIFEILVLLAAGGNMSEADIANERIRLNNGWTLDKLRSRKNQIETAQRLVRKMKNNGLDAVKAERAEMRGDNVPQAVALLPAEHTPQSLKNLARDNYPAFKKLVEQFGEQVTARLQGR